MKQVWQAKLGLYLGAALWAGFAVADAPGTANGIYSCTDASGRRITSDRPIAACVDREQRVLGNTGVELRRLGPTLTEQERAAQEAKHRQEQAEQLQLREERSRERAMLLRYPNQGVHDEARTDALAQVNDVIAIAKNRQTELTQRRRKLNTEMEFYQKDPKKRLQTCVASSRKTTTHKPSSSATSRSRSRKSNASISALMRSCNSCANFGWLKNLDAHQARCMAMTRASNSAATQARPPISSGICNSKPDCACNSQASAFQTLP